jgi:hypothetical protein
MTWAGDSSILYSANGRDCERLDVATLGDSGALDAALRAWVAAGHNGVVTRTGPVVRLDVCDPGPTAPAPPAHALSMADVADLHGQLVEGIRFSTHLAEAEADCVGDVTVEVANTAGLNRIVELGVEHDGAGLVRFSLALGIQARPLIRSACPGTVAPAANTTTS